MHALGPGPGLRVRAQPLPLQAGRPVGPCDCGRRRRRDLQPRVRPDVWRAGDRREHDLHLPAQRSGPGALSFKGSDHCLSFYFSAFPCGSTALTSDRCNQAKCGQPNCAVGGQSGAGWPLDPAAADGTKLCNAECVELPINGEPDSSQVVDQLACGNAPTSPLYAAVQRHGRVGAILQEYLKNAFFSFGLFAFSVLLLVALMSYLCLHKSHYTALFFCAVGINW
eukprot:SAG22_NODE_208_length_15237_cov_22.602774_8_plen_224_part_00